MLFDKKVKTCGYEVIKEGNLDVLKVNCNGCPYSPSLEDSEICMARTVDKLIEVSSTSRMTFSQRRNYGYDYNQTQILMEIANLYKYLIKQKKILSLDLLPQLGTYSDYYRGNLQYIILNLLRSDPIGAYVELIRLIREEKIKIDKTDFQDELNFRTSYIEILTGLKNLLDDTTLIKIVKPYIAGHVVGTRALYRNVFKPSISPDFMFTKLMSEPPAKAEEIDSYSLKDNVEVNIFKIPGEVQYLYHVNPPEFKISEDKYSVLDMARNALAEHKPSKEEFIDPEKMRRTFFNIGRDLIQELCEHRGFDLGFKEIEELTKILVRYTVGFGLIEILLEDTKIQDINVNGPIGETRIFVVHEEYGECVTNIIPSKEDGESWASKFRILSGRPLDEANPILDTELILPRARARVSIIGRPLNPLGLGYTFRRHRDRPWTYPLFIKGKMMNPLAAGLLSFLIDGNRSILFAGTRSSGKCVDGDTLIQLSDGNLLPIKELIGSHKEIIDDGNIYYPKNKYKVPCLNRLNLINSNITYIWKRSSPEKMIKLKTKSGKEIITTPEHPYFIYKSGLNSIRADSLSKKDLIAIPRKIEINGNDISVNLEKEDYFRKESDNYYILKGATNSLQFKFPKKITPEMGWFLGLVIGDGYLDLRKLELHNLCFEIREKYKSFLRELDLKFREFKSHTSVVVQVSNRSFSRLLNKYFEIPFGKKSDKIIIPPLILKSSKDILSAFLRGYFDTDGYIPKLKRDIEIVSASPMMIKQLETVLLRFEIVGFSKIKIVKNKKYYRFFIRGEFLNKFNENIGFSHPFKKERLKEIMNTKFLKNTNVDVIPEGNKIISELRTRLRLSPKNFRLSGKDYWAYENNKHRISRNWFLKIINFYKDHYYNRLESMKDEIELVRNLTYFDYNNLMNKTEKLRILLGLSYKTLSHDIEISNTAIRKTLQKGVEGNIDKICSFISLYNTFKERLNYLDNITKDKEFTIDSIPFFVDSNITSYVEISKKCEIKETTLKSYVYGGIKPSCENLRSIEEEMLLIKSDLKSRLKEANNILFDIKTLSSITENIQFGIILGNLRNLLNIKNEELISYDASLQTVSNFFNGKYKCGFKTVQSISKTILEMYDSCVNNKTELLINEAEMLANSDIFWDEVLSVEIIDKIDDFVYDLTVKDTHNFVANGLIAHNTSLLGASLIEIMRRYRIISTEDTLELPIEALRDLGYNIQPMKVRSALMSGGNEISADEGIRTSLRMGDSCLIVGEIRSSIRGNEKVLIVEEGITKRLPIKDLENKDISKIYLPSMDFDLKFKLKKLTAFVKHPKRSKLIEVTTRTGRKITVTKDHSLFTHKDFKIIPIECQNLTKGTKIIIPEKLPAGYNNVQLISLFDILDGEDCKVVGYEQDLKQIINKLGYKRAGQITNCSNDIYQYLRRGHQHTNISIDYYKELAKRADLKYNTQLLQIKKGTSKVLNAEMTVTNEFCRFLGYYASEGWTDLNGDVTFSNNDQVIIEDITNLSKILFGIEAYIRKTKGLGISTQINLNNKILGLILKNLGCGRIALEKRVPSIIFGLSEEKICEFLKGYFDGDGSQTSNLSSGNRIACSTISKDLADDLLYLFLQLGIVARVYIKKNKGIGKHISYVIEFKQRKYIEIFLQKVGFRKYQKKLIKRNVSHSNQNTVDYNINLLEEHIQLKREFRHLRRYNSCGKDYLKKIVDGSEKSSNLINLFVNGDFFLDEVKQIKEISLNKGEYVYDLSVSPCQNFIGGFGGILLHNTEALALYEAMRIGALANVVAGTIHGADPYGVFDRVVNDLKVPRTSFKATDIIVISNPVRSADGLHKWRRMLQITEVRKHWEEDPLRENGFVDLMKYDAKEDTLKPSDDLLNGDSEVLKAIAGTVKEWAGDWNAVWDNILLRAQIKDTLVNYALKSNRYELLEAKFVVASNDMFHRICDSVKEDTGTIDNKRVFFEWEEWLRNSIKKKGFG